MVEAIVVIGIRFVLEYTDAVESPLASGFHSIEFAPVFLAGTLDITQFFNNHLFVPGELGLSKLELVLGSRCECT